MKTADVVVIGTGLVGAAVAHDLHRAGHAVVVCEAGPELGSGASRSNSGVLHTGFDSPQGTFETRMILRQGQRWREVFAALNIPYRQPGALLRATEGEAARLEELALKAQENGVETRLLNRAEVARAESGAPAAAGLLVPGEAITDPLEVVTRLLSGVEVRLGTLVLGVEAKGDGVEVRTEDGPIRARFAVNCAGLFADELPIAGSPATPPEFRITARRGEFLVFEQGSASLARHILLPMPNAFTKGVLVFPTLHGHLCAGPTAEDQDDKRDWRPHPAGLREVQHRALEILPALRDVPVVDAWAGLRPVGHPHTYLCQFSARVPALLHLAGIRSTGLSACLGLSEWALEQLGSRGLETRTTRTVSPPAAPLGQPWWQRLNRLRRVGDALQGLSTTQDARAAGH